jgi:hypothetical protein
VCHPTAAAKRTTSTDACGDRGAGRAQLVADIELEAQLANREELRRLLAALGRSFNDNELAAVIRSRRDVRYGRSSPIQTEQAEPCSSIKALYSSRT